MDVASVTSLTAVVKLGAAVAVILAVLPLKNLAKTWVVGGAEAGFCVLLNALYLQVVESGDFD